MIRADIHASTLTEYYEQLVMAQQLAHGFEYTTHHTAIRQAAAEGCRSYAELGVNQGATLACALLAGFGTVVGVDIALEPWRPAEALFRAHVSRTGQALYMIERDSRMALPITPDFLLIDTRHETGHLRQELTAHGFYVVRFILIHDTAAVPALHNAAVAWGLRAGWTVQQRDTRSVGWTLLRRWA